MHELTPQQSEPVSLLEFSEAAQLFTQYIAANGPIEQVQETSRRLRANKVDVEQMKAAGELQAGQTYIGVRLISQNIKNSLPPLLAYLKNSPRMATFSPGDNGYLDQEFTRVLQYQGWEVPYICVLDSAEQNGLGYLRVMYDETKLGNVSFNYCEYDHVIYDRRLRDIQDSPAVLIKHTVTRVSFFHWDAFESFNKQSKAYESIVRLISDPKLHSEINVYEAFMKIEGVVYRGWYYDISGDWLKPPQVFSNGIVHKVPEINIDMSQPIIQGAPNLVDENKPSYLYPIVVKRFEITSELRHDLAEGRAQNDYHKQESATTLMTAAVNGCTQAANTMWSPDGANVDGVAPAQLSFKIKNNAIWKTSMKAFTAPWPDPMIFKGIESIIQQNAQESNQVAWSVNNRKDSRKTATEIEAAQQQQGLLSGTDALIFSIFLRELFTMAWPIVKSSAESGRIEFLIEDVNKEATLSKNYEIKPAGDVDFIEKQQRLNNLQQDIPMFNGSPVAKEMTKEYIRLRYPERFSSWSKLMDEQDTSKELLKAVGDALKGAVTDEATGQLKPEFQPEAQSLGQLEQSVQMFLQPQPAK
jgi:hypothetical protein